MREQGPIEQFMRARLRLPPEQFKAEVNAYVAKLYADLAGETIRKTFGDGFLDAGSEKVDPKLVVLILLWAIASVLVMVELVG